MEIRFEWKFCAYWADSRAGIPAPMKKSTHSPTLVPFVPLILTQKKETQLFGIYDDSTALPEGFKPTFFQIYFGYYFL